MLLHSRIVDGVPVMFMLILSDDDMIEGSDSDFETSKTATKVYG